MRCAERVDQHRSGHRHRRLHPSPVELPRLWGFRPTHGSVSTDGVLALAPSFDTVSWLTRDASTLAAVGDVLLPADTATAPLRAVWSSDVNAVADPDVQEKVEHAAQLLDADPLPPLPDLAEWTAAFRTVQAHEAWAEHGEWLTAHPGASPPMSRAGSPRDAM